MSAPTVPLGSFAPPDRIVVDWCPSCGALFQAFETMPGHLATTFCPRCVGNFPLRHIRYQLTKRLARVKPRRAR